MRRSLAPSLKNNSLLNYNKLTSLTSSNVNLGRSSTAAFDASKENLEYDKSTVTGEICFNVVWGKRSNKKHKTYEGDGTIAGSNGRFVLKDASGTVLGSTNSLKAEDLYEGSQLLIGGKRVELLDKLPESPLAGSLTKIPQTDEHASRCFGKPKKRKSSSLFSPNLHIAKIRLPAGTSTSQADPLEDFTLPTPTCGHQMKYNTENLPINEVKVARSLLKMLRPHQREGVVFLYECIQGFRDLNNFGAVLADDMGLGKTLQCLTVCHTLLKNAPYGHDSVLKKILIVTPSSLTHHWDEEVTKWLSCERLFSYVVSCKNKLKQYPNTSHVPFVIISYEMLVKYSVELQNWKFDLLICDEGHRLKNNEIKVAGCLRQLNISRRIVLTGTPIQNDLQEFFALVDFVNPGILGEYSAYRQKYEKPIILSHAPGASEDVRRLGEERVAELNEITNQFILRRTQSVSKKYLPKKTEFIVFARPTELQQILLEKALEWLNLKDGRIGQDGTALQIITVLKKICNHPSLLRTTSRQDNPLVQYLLQFLPKWNEMGPFHSSKLKLVHHFLREAIIDCKERVVLVSNHTKTLDMLCALCAQANYSFLRLDGSTTISDRNSSVEKFNKPKSNVSVFLLSAKAGGLGLNLSGASRLLLFDNDWNPAIDAQAMSRIWRDGQQRDVKIFRLITAGTIEEKIFQRQIAKTSLIDCVVDQRHKIDTLKMSEDELKDIFSIQENYDTCITHTSLQCDCNGTGENVNKMTPQRNINPFDVVISEVKTQDDVFQLNELMSWKHFKHPFSNEVLQEASLAGSAEDIIYIFSNTTEVI